MVRCGEVWLGCSKVWLSCGKMWMECGELWHIMGSSCGCHNSPQVGAIFVVSCGRLATTHHNPSHLTTTRCGELWHIVASCGSAIINGVLTMEAILHYSSPSTYAIALRLVYCPFFHFSVLFFLSWYITRSVFLQVSQHSATLSHMAHCQIGEQAATTNRVQQQAAIEQAAAVDGVQQQSTFGQAAAMDEVRKQAAIEQATTVDGVQ